MDNSKFYFPILSSPIIARKSSNFSNYSGTTIGTIAISSTSFVDYSLEARINENNKLYMYVYTSYPTNTSNKNYLLIDSKYEIDAIVNTYGMIYQVLCFYKN